MSEFRRHIIGRLNASGGGGGRVLPSGFTRLMFVEASGTQYIEFNSVTTSSQSTFEIDLEYTSAAQFQNIWGYYNNGSDFFRIYSNTSTTIAFTSSKGLTTALGSYSARKVVGIYGDRIELDGETLQSGDYTPMSGRVLYGFKYGGSGLTKGRIYSYKHYISNVIAEEYVPARRDEDGAVGLYDIVNDKFKVSGSSTALIAGPVV